MNKQNSGFTLIELLAVIVIIAIIAMIGIFSVTKIMSKARMNSLKNTALAVRKAATLYIASNSEITYPKTVDVTPGDDGQIDPGDEASLMELSKDPWGNDFEQVLAVIEEVDDKKQITVYLFTKQGDYYLTHNSDILNKLVFQAAVLTVPSSNIFGEDVLVKYQLPTIYNIDGVDVKLKRNGVTAILGTDYLLPTPTFVRGPDDMYSLILDIKKPGAFELSLVVKDGARIGVESSKESFSVTPPAPPTFSSIAVVADPVYSGYRTVIDRRVEFKMANTTTLPIKCNVERWDGTNWIEIISNRSITANTTYRVMHADVLGDNLTDLFYDHSRVYVESPEFYHDEYWYYKFRIKITNGVTSTTSSEMSYYDEYHEW